MRQFQRVSGKRTASSVLRQLGRQQSTDHRPNSVVSVRAKGYGPSRNLVEGVGANQRVVVETRMHPRDIEVQRGVLALTKPSLSDVAVVNAPDHRRYGSNGAPLPHSSVFASSAREQPADAAEAALRMELLEHSLESQLANLANLIIEQVEKTTGAQLAGLEVRQSGDAQDLANTIVQSMRSELRRSPMPAQADAPAGAAGVNMEDLTRRISERVVRVLQEGIESRAARMDLLEGKVDAYFTELQSTMSRALAPSAPATAVSTADGSPVAAGVPSVVTEELRTALVDAVAQAAQVQRESLLSVLEDFMADGASGGGGRAHGAGAGSPAVDMKTLEEFIEGSLRVATDDIRHSVAAELKKAARAGKGSAGRADDAAGAATALPAALQELADRLDMATISAKRTLKTVEAVEESLSAVKEEQQHAKELLFSIKALLEQQQRLQVGPGSAAATESTTSPAASAHGTQPPSAAGGEPILTAVKELQQSISTLSAAMDVGGELMDERLMGMAQVISESVLAAVETRTGEALTTAVAAVEAQVRALTAMQEQLSREPPITRTPAAPASTDAAPSHEGASLADELMTGAANVRPTGTPAPAAAVDMDVLRADIAAAVDAVLGPKLQAALDRVHVSLAQQPEHEAALAQSISDAVIAAVTAARADSAPAATAAPAAEQLSERLDALRTELVATVEREMGKTHEVNLTPMYKYVDSMLTFLKDELSAQEGSIDRKITEAAAQLSELITAAREPRTETESTAHRAVSSEELQQLASKIESTVAAATQAATQETTAAVTAAVSAAAAAAAAEASAKEDAASQAVAAAVARQSEASAAKLAALETVSERMVGQLGAVESALRSATDQQQALVRERLDEVLSRSDSQTADIRASLSKFEASLAAQATSIEALSPAARAQHMSWAAAASESVSKLGELRTSTSTRLASITETVGRIEKTKSTSERARLVRELQGDFAALAELRASEDAHVAVLTKPQVIVASAEAAEAAAPVLQELARVAADLDAKITNGSQAQSGAREELLAAMSDIVAGLKSSGEMNEATSRLVRERTGALEELVRSQQEASTERLVRELASSTATVLKEASTTQVSAMVEKMAEQSDRQIVARLSEGFSQQMAALQTLVADGLKRSSEVAMSDTHVERSAVAVRKQLEQVMAAADAARQGDRAQVVAPVARVPLWWLLANPLLVCGAILACAYYILACFLIAFVPFPGQELTAGSAGGAVSSSPAGGSKGESATSQAPLDPMWSGRDGPRRDRRVADCVL